MADTQENDVFETNQNIEQQEETSKQADNELPQNEILTKDQIIDQIKNLIDEPVNTVKDTIDLLKQSYYKLRKAEIENLRKAYLSENPDNKEKDFSIESDPLEEKLKGYLNIFKEKKAVYQQEQEKIKENNYLRKVAIIDEIKKFINDSDNINKYYTQFQQLQQNFKEIANIPANKVNEVWKAYQTTVEQFYDLLKINKELRDYDFKKNLDQKIALCESAEALATQEDIISSFRTLQQLHDEWREVGPVAKELREELWNRFKNASSVINKQHQQYFELQKENEKKNEEGKIALCEKIETIDTDSLTTFTAWDEKTKEIIALQEEWKTFGFASRKMNNQLFERFRESCDKFFKQKAEFFKSVKEKMAKNLEAKRALCEKAESLKDSTDWKNTAEQLTALQKEWKTIGPVSKKYSDQVWKRFIAACDYFFEQKAKNNSSKKQEEIQNLALKKEVIEKLSQIPDTADPETGIKEIKALMAEWNNIGHVPYKEKDKIYKEYQDALDLQFGRFSTHENKKRLINYSSSVQKLASGDQSQNKLYRERDKLMKAFERAKNELQTYENNMGFLTLSSKNAGSLVKEMERKMQKLKEEMDLITKKIDLIDENL